MPVLHLREITKRVADGASRRVLIDGVDLTLDRGELVVLRGPSGSGKTTLLAIAGAMLLPTSGEVELDGEPVSRMRDHHRALVRRRKVGFVFQDVQLVEAMSVAENALLPRVPDGVRPEDRARSGALLDRFGVAGLAHRTARSLSGGERQRVALARALLCDPPLLLLDEPTAHLDDERAEQVAADLAALADEGRAVLVATHDPRVARAPKVTRVVDLVHGRLRDADAAAAD